MHNRQNIYSRLSSAAFIILGVFILTALGGKPAVAGAKPETQILEGVLLGSSAKAGLVSIQVGERNELIVYDEQTTGLDEVEQGDNVVLRYRSTDGRRTALAIEPLLAELPKGVTEIDPEDLLEIISAKVVARKYLLVDCRPADFYAETHLPTAISIPWTEQAARKAALLPDDRDTLLIFYCLGPTCLLGPNSAALAVEAGYRNVRVMLSELAEWQEIGGQLYSSDSYITAGNIVLIDLRSRQDTEAGHIPGATNLTLADLHEAEYDFPTKKSAPVVLYGSEKETTGAVAVIKGWGFQQVSLIEGGYAGWVGRGNPVRTGPAANTISWKKQPEEGEISLTDFNQAVTANAADTVIVDVRTAAEMAGGKLDNSVHLPLSELKERFAEIPADRQIILHCTTGARAKMAWVFLKQHRARVRFLHAKVTCRNGKCRVRP